MDYQIPAADLYTRNSR